MLIHQIYIDWGAKKPSIFDISKRSWENLGKYKLFLQKIVYYYYHLVSLS